MEPLLLSLVQKVTCAYQSLNIKTKGLSRFLLGVGGVLKSVYAGVGGTFRVTDTVVEFFSALVGFFLESEK